MKDLIVPVLSDIILTLLVLMFTTAQKVSWNVTNLDQLTYPYITLNYFYILYQNDAD